MMKMSRKHAYHSESCHGMVTADFFVEKGVVSAVFVDGDLGTIKRTWRYEQRKEELYIVDTVYVNGVEFEDTTSRPLRGDRAALLDAVCEDWEELEPFGFSVNPKKLRKGLERFL